MVQKIFYSNSPENQNEIAEYIVEAASLNPIVLFKGEMGAGKTTLIKNICNFLDVKDDVNSPTFSIVNEYETKKGEILYHFDFYRIEEEEEALDIGCEDYFYSKRICLIEWPSKIENLIPAESIEVEISLNDEQRTIAVRIF
jgi:tRNA threonylcarbamoyladenosine biosynthesis protein TsaE